MSREVFTRRPLGIWGTPPTGSHRCWLDVAKDRPVGERGAVPASAGPSGRPPAPPGSTQSRHAAASGECAAHRDWRDPVNMSGLLLAAPGRAAVRRIRRTGLPETDVDGEEAPSVAGGCTTGVTSPSPTAQPVGRSPDASQTRRPAGVEPDPAPCGHTGLGRLRIQYSSSEKQGHTKAFA